MLLHAWRIQKKKKNVEINYYPLQFESRVEIYEIKNSPFKYDIIYNFC